MAVAMLLAIAPPSNGAAMVIRPDDFAILKYAVCQADVKLVFGSVWSVHPGGFALGVRSIFPTCFTSNVVNMAFGFTCYLVLLWMIQRFIERSFCSSESQVPDSSQFLTGVFVYSVGLSPALASCWYRFTEEVAAALVTIDPRRPTTNSFGVARCHCRVPKPLAVGESLSSSTVARLW